MCCGQASRGQNGFPGRIRKPDLDPGPDVPITARPRIVEMELRQRALQVLCLSSPSEKVDATQALHRAREALELDVQAPLSAPSDVSLPGRPHKPELVQHTSVARRSPHTLEGRAALLHAIAHIEFNAINLALDAVWRFPGMPPAYYLDWLKVAAEEAYHFSLLRQQLQTMPHSGRPWDYGDFPAHQGLWTMCERTAGDIVARMALVPRTMEARGLDATPQIQAKLRRVGTSDALQACALLDIILRDEVGHVAIGNHWFRWLCEREGLDPVTHYPILTQRHQAPRLRPPFNECARRDAGFTADEMAWLQNG